MVCRGTTHTGFAHRRPHMSKLLDLEPLSGFRGGDVRALGPARTAALQQALAGYRVPVIRGRQLSDPGPKAGRHLRARA